MKTYKIYSPAYRPNGLKGTYYSIAWCENNGEIIRIYGDHAWGRDGRFFHEGYPNIADIVGMPFSDADRCIQIEEVEIDSEEFDSYFKQYTEYQHKRDAWDKAADEITGADRYWFFYDKKGKEITKNWELYRSWARKNPTPRMSVEYYDFLKAIK